MTGPRPEQPGPDQESVWDYPRPPRLETSTDTVDVVLGGMTIASTTSSWRVLETSHPPTYYLPREAFATGVLRDGEGASWCEWKGRATYLDLVAERVVARSTAWTYLEPMAAFVPIAGAIAVMPGWVDRCVVNGEVVEAQPGGFYCGWITSRVVGPFKGDPGTGGW